MKVIGGDFPREGVDRDGNDDAWMGFGGGDERFANVLDRNLILHMAEMIRVFVYTWILRRLSRIRRKRVASPMYILLRHSHEVI